MKWCVDINADVAEGLDNEPLLMPYLSSCNIACGGHAGDIGTMTKTVRLAKQYGVKIGAHPSYPDPCNFGRRPMKISSKDLLESITQQINNLLNILKEQGTALHHIKPHGALYNIAAKDEAMATLIVSATKMFGSSLKLYAPYGSMMAKIAKQKSIPVVYEAFIDRTYTDDLSLVARGAKHAVIANPKSAFEQVYGIIKKQKVKTIDGVEVPIFAETFCVHGDNPNAEIILKEVRNKLMQHHIQIR